MTFFSRARPRERRARQQGSGIDPGSVDNYLLDVDKPLVLPVDTKVRFLITADDVIHAWWVPDFGWKQDAIPGFINEAWTGDPDSPAPTAASAPSCAARTTASCRSSSRRSRRTSTTRGWRRSSEFGRRAS